MSRLPHAIAGLAVLGAVGTCAASRCGGDDELPAPLWTEADLPAIPAAADNGWVTLRTVADHGLASSPPDAAIDALSLHDGQRPADVWERLIEARTALDAWRTDSDTRAALDTFREAATMPTFADACALDVASRCPHFEIFQITRAATIHALWQASRGDLTAAGEELAAVISSQRRYRDTARTLIAAAVATAGLRGALDAAAVLVWRLDTTPADPKESLDGLRQEIEAITTASRVAKHALVGEYVLATAALMAVADGDAEVGEGWAPTWLLDRAWTRDRFDRSYQVSMALATGDSTVPATPDALSMLDRMLHPVGAPLWTMLDPSLMTDGMVEKLRSDGEDIARQRKELLAQLR